ncbi:ATP-binding protein [Streptomyces erythrochromogenes]|uniref:ATP-binding protein n=1 Tax=Streptomyces erythrochromogenes TaxID=285574 RepID=UPI00381E542E
MPSLRRDVLAHLATGTFVAKAESVIMLGPPGIGMTYLRIGRGVKAASNWIARLQAAHQAGRHDAELKKIRAATS